MLLHIRDPTKLMGVLTPSEITERITEINNNTAEYSILAHTMKEILHIGEIKTKFLKKELKIKIKIPLTKRKIQKLCQITKIPIKKGRDMIEIITYTPYLLRKTSKKLVKNVPCNLPLFLRCK